MPHVTGFAVLEVVKSDPALRHLPIVVISAAGELKNVVRCIELGAEDFLSKPFETAILWARVGASLERKRLRDNEQAYLRLHRTGTRHVRTPAAQRPAQTDRRSAA